MKNFTKKAAVAFCAVSMLLTAGCTKKTDDTPVVDASEGFVTIEFYYDSQTRGEAEYIKLIDTYNQTQGQTDKVVVIGTPVPGITNSAQSHMMRDNAPNVITVGDKSFKSLAVQNGLMLSLEDYAKDSGVTDDMPAELVNRFRFTSDTMEAGAGAELLGVPPTETLRKCSIITPDISNSRKSILFPYLSRIWMRITKKMGRASCRTATRNTQPRTRR